jgi:hypothetical protein
MERGLPLLRYDIIDIQVDLKDKTINIAKADELSSAELSGNYFDLVLRRPDGVRFRYRNEIGSILSDGTIRLIANDEDPRKAVSTFKLLLGIAKKMVEFDEENEILNFDLVLILIFGSKKGAINTISNFIGKEKIDIISKALEEAIAAPYFGVYLREFGKLSYKEYMDIDVEPSSEDVNKYWVKIRYKIKEQKGIGNLLRYIEEMINKASLITNLLEGGR